MGAIILKLPTARIFFGLMNWKIRYSRFQLQQKQNEQKAPKSTKETWKKKKELSLKYESKN